MWIKKIYIENFGKLSDASFDFLSHQNLIYGENEQGKSTMMTFIRTMFYGFSGTKTQDIQKNERRKYLPWNKGVCGGFLELEADGVSYRIERSFGDVPRKDTLKVIDLAANEFFSIPSGREAGEHFLKMSAETFDNSVYISQLGSVFDPGRSKENEIVRKLQNLASTGTETQSYHQVNTRLQSAIDQLKSKRGGQGVLDRLEQERIELEQAKHRALEMEEEKKRLSDEYDTLSRNYEDIRNEVDEYSKKQEYLRQFEITRQAKQILEKHDELIRLNKESARLTKESEIDASALSLTQLDQMKSKAAKLLHNEVYLHHLNHEINAQGNNSGELNEIASTSEALDEIRQILFFINSIPEKRAATEKMSRHIEEIRRLTEKKGEYEIKESNIITRKDIITSQQQNNTTCPPGTLKIFIILLATFLPAVIASAAGIFIHPSFYGLAAGLCLVFFTWLAIVKMNTSSNNKRRKIQQDQFFHSAQAFNENLRFIENELAEVTARIEWIFSEAGKTDNETPAEFLNRYEKQMLCIMQDISSVQEKADVISQKYHQQSVADLQKYYDHLVLKDREQQLINEGKHRQMLQLERLREQHEKETAGFIQGEGKPLGIIDLEHAQEVLDRLTDLFYRYQGLVRTIAEKERDLRDLMAGRTHAQVLLDYENGSRYLESQKTDPDPLAWTGDYAEELRRKHTTKKEQLNQIYIDMATLQADIRHRFGSGIQISEFDLSLKNNRDRQIRIQKEYQALLCAQTGLKEAFEQMQQSFGPIVNQKCSAIFSRLTGNRYNEILVSKDLDMSVRDPLSRSTFEWKYLSGGTIDQLYFSLRLAIAEVFAESVNGLPVFLDDSFLQYDDRRARNAFAFLNEYAPEHRIQIFFFTCHDLYADMVSEEAGRIDLLGDNA